MAAILTDSRHFLFTTYGLMLFSRTDQKPIQLTTPCILSSCRIAALRLVGRPVLDGRYAEWWGEGWLFVGDEVPDRWSLDPGLT